MKALSKSLFSVKRMLHCRAAGTRLADRSHEGAFGEANVCNKLFWSEHHGKHARVGNLRERQNDDELHQLQTWVLRFHVVLGYPGDRHVINTSRQTHFGGVPAAVGKLQIRNSNRLVTGTKNISQRGSVLGGLFLSR